VAAEGAGLLIRRNGETPVTGALGLRVIITTDRCKGCGLCVAVCPPTVLALGPLNVMGYPAATLIDNARCTSCAACAMICPESAVAVYKPPRPVRKEAGA
jgi:2-oxoglutarate ferredoxin oxidoreductase subunit delta